MDAQQSFRGRLITHGILIPMGVEGLYARSAVFERIIEGLETAVARLGSEDQAEMFYFPPGMAQKTFEQSGYLRGFPQLAGSVQCFCGDDKAHRHLLNCVETGEDWTRDQQSSHIVLTPATCYPLYPIIARRGPLAQDGYLASLQSWCFRHEPSLEPTRMQMFRMREWVRMGTEDHVLAARETWMQRGQNLIRALELPFEIEVANDPFFGRTGKFLANSQREMQHKFELTIPVNDGAGPTACLSFNYHVTKFGETFNLRTADGDIAHTACVGFGLERLALALLRHHGLEPQHWPASARTTLQQWN